MPAKKTPPPAVTSKPAATGFSLSNKGPKFGSVAGSGGGFSLAVPTKQKDQSPITAPMPPRDAPIPGQPLELEVGENEDIAELREKLDKPRLTAAEFNAKKKRESDRLALATDASFYVGVVFSCAEDADKFLEAVGILVYDQFVDGYELCRKLKIDVQPRPLEPPIVNVLDFWYDLAMDVVDEADADPSLDLGPKAPTRTTR